MIEVHYIKLSIDTFLTRIKRLATLTAVYIHLHVF
jgi:hypothetical protein